MEAKSNAGFTLFRPHVLALNRAIEQAYHILLFSRSGLSLATGPNHKIIYSQGKKPDSSYLVGKTVDTTLAKDEVANDFPLLHSQFIILIWAILESTIKGFFADWLENEPSALEAPEIQKIKMEVGEFHRLKGKDFYYYLLQRLEQDRGSAFKSGVERFEELFRMFGIGSALDANLKRELIELQQLRNVFVHHGGTIDKHFVSKCGWTSYKEGVRVKISSDESSRLCMAALKYGTALVTRMREHESQRASS